MGAPAVRVRSASIVLPTIVNASYPPQDWSHHGSRSAPLRGESPSRALSESTVNSVVQPHPAISRTPDTMATQADGNLHEPTQSERDLAAEIARAMHRRPLMNRLARIESAHAGVLPENGLTQSGQPSSAPILSPPPMPSHAAVATSSPAQAAPIDSVQNHWEGFSPPGSTEWLSKARRERNRSRLKNGLAWLSTVAIGGMIIASTILALQA